VRDGGAPISGEIIQGKVSTPIKVVDNNNGTYDLSFVVHKSGAHDVNIKIGDQLLKGAPFSVVVNPGEVSIDNTEIKFLDLPLAGLSGATLRMMDEQHNVRLTGGDHVVAVCTPLSPLCVSARDNGDGSYAIVFPPHAKGKHKVNVKVNGSPAPKGPWEVMVKENPLPEDKKKKVANLMPKSSSVLNRLLSNASEKERDEILAELSTLRK